MIRAFGGNERYKAMSNAVRVLSMEAVERAQSGHPGMPMGMADVATVLFDSFLKFNPNDPEWFDRDRFVLSAGHGSMLLYSLLYLTAYPKMSLEEIQAFRQLGSLTPGHPEYGHTPGVETTTGPLGQGFANAVGMAMAEKRLAKEWGADLVDHKTYAFVGDGCLMEGISQEAISLAGHLELGNLIVLFDDNQITIDGPTSLSTKDDVIKRFQASCWHTQSVDGHDYTQIYEAIAQAHHHERPSLIACKTTIGFGSPTKAGTASAHGSPLGREEIIAAKKALGWEAEGFDVPGPILDQWRQAWNRNTQAYVQWQRAYGEASEEVKRRIKGRLNEEPIQTALTSQIQMWEKDPPRLATRQASQIALEALYPQCPEFMGGSADLTPSNNTHIAAMGVYTPTQPHMPYVHYGIREHAMVAAMNGIALHGGLIPYGGTFLAFTDYCRPSIRLAALMGIRVIMVMTHDSIGLGEDGPTHQPVEHLASLRAIPNLYVWRPSDALETLVSWGCALESKTTPSVLALSRQALAPVGPFTLERANLVKRGGYVVKEATASKRQVSLVATGSEVSVALDAALKLEEQGIGAAVISLPCFERFDAQEKDYKASVLGDKTVLKVAIEAAVCQGWEKYITDEGIFVGMSSFGASAPALALYRHFGITSEEVVLKVLSRI
jgi:transketolase